MGNTILRRMNQGKKLRILYISREEIPASHGGAVHTWEVARNMARLGHSITVLCHRLHHQNPFEILEGVKIIRCPMSVKGKKVPILGMVRFHQILNIKADIIMERFDTFGGLGAILSRLLGIPLLLEVNYPHLEEMVWKWRERRSWIARQGWLIHLLGSWNRWQFKTSQANVAPLKTIVPEFAVSRTHLVHWGADFTEFNPRNRSGSRCTELLRSYNLEGKTIIIFVGSFKPWHGALDLPAIISETSKKTTKRVYFVLVGDGEMWSAVKQSTVTQGLFEQCLFLGQRPHREVASWLALADIAIAPYNANYYHPMKQFGFFWSPAKIFEYMATGLPVVAADYFPLNRIIRDGFNGRNVTPGDIPQYGTTIAQLVEDPDKARQMGTRARRLAKSKYGWIHHTLDLERIIFDVVSDRASIN